MKKEKRNSSKVYSQIIDLIVSLENNLRNRESFASQLRKKKMDIILAEKRAKINFGKEVTQDAPTSYNSALAPFQEVLNNPSASYANRHLLMIIRSKNLM